jgi:Domain of unknown function (DUF3846)
MKAILIDSVTRSVSEVEYNGDYRHIYELIDCDTFTIVRIGHNDVIYVDDEGLLKDSPPCDYFMYRGYHQPLAGKGLVLGTNEEGDSVAPIHTLSQIKDRVEFVELNLMGFEEINETMDHPLLGPNTPVIGSRPIFLQRKSDKTD